MAARASYMGIPREEIPWYPTVDFDLCTGCAECLEVCPNDVYELLEFGLAIVAKPNHCAVLCDKCRSFCEQEAISFPDKREFEEKLAGMIRKRHAGTATE